MRVCYPNTKVLKLISLVVETGTMHNPFVSRAADCFRIYDSQAGAENHLGGGQDSETTVFF